MAWYFYLPFHCPLQPTVQVILFLFIGLLSEMWFVFNFKNNIFSGSVLQIFSWMLPKMPENKPDFPKIYPIKRWKNKSWEIVSVLAEELISFLFTYGRQSIWILLANCFLLTVFSRYKNNLFWWHLVLNLQKCVWWVLAVINISYQTHLFTFIIEMQYLCMFELAELPVLHHPEARNQYLKDRCAINSAGSKRSLKVFAHMLFTEKNMWIVEMF